MSSEIYKIASSLAADLAEGELQANMCEMFIENSRQKAKDIRELAEKEPNNPHFAVCEFHRIQRSVYAAIYQLLEGYKGYKLVDVSKNNNYPVQ